MSVLSCFTCTTAYSEITQHNEVDGTSEVVDDLIRWTPARYPKLLIEGRDNIYSHPIWLTGGQNASVEFREGSFLEIEPNDKNGFTLNGSAKLDISGNGTLRIDRPNNDDQFSKSGGFYLEGTSTETPSVDIHGDNLNLIIEAHRGISLSYGAKFNFNSPNGNIYIGGGQEGPDLYKRGLMTGITLRADRTTTPTELNIDAKNLYIYSGNASANPNSTEMISTSALENPMSSYLKGDVNINIHAGTLALLVSDQENSVPQDTLNGFGIYSQSGRYYQSTINLSGNEFGFSAPVKGWYGVYMLDYGQENHVSLKFDDTIQMYSNGDYLIALIHMLAPNIEDTSLDIEAGKRIILENRDEVAIDNAGGLINIKAPDIRISSANSYAIWTTELSDNLGGTTNVTGENIFVNAPESIAIVTQGNANRNEYNGLANIKGDNILLQSAHGGVMYTYDKGKTTVDGKKIDILSDTGFGISTDTGAMTEIKGNDVTVASDALAYTIFTNGTNSLTNINYDEANQEASNQTTKIKGRVLSTNDGVTNIGLASASSEFIGSTDDGYYYQAQGENAFGPDNKDPTTAGQISIYANNGSVWRVKPNPISIRDTEEIGGIMNAFSNLSHYHSSGFSLVDLTTAEGAQDLDIANLTGNDASFQLRTYIDNLRITGGSGNDTQIRDHVNILQGNGQHYIVLKSTGLGYPYEKQSDYLVLSRAPNTLYITDPKTGETEGTPGQDSLSFKLGAVAGGNAVNPIPYVQALSKIDLGIYNYVLATRDNAHDGIEMEGTEYYLLRDGSYTPSTDLDRTLAGFGAEYAIWWAELSDLRKRLGEVRYGAQDGPWVRYITQKDDIDGVGHGSFIQKTHGINVGFDHIVTQDENRMWLLGGNLRYSYSDQDVRHSAHAKGSMHSWGMNLYATYANEKGYYSDLVFTYDHFDREARSMMLDNTPVSGNWSNYGLGASIEVGKMMSSTQDDEGWGPWYNHWWIEPQAQLAYYHINGKSFTLSNGLKAGQDDIDFLTGRLGVVIGKKFNYRKNREEVDKRYSQFYVKGGIKHEFLGDQELWISDGANRVDFSDSLGETRVYYGAGIDWNLTDQLRLYTQIEREHGEKYMKDYEFSIGLKWQF